MRKITAASPPDALGAPPEPAPVKPETALHAH
jgi:hypothetical protein